MQAGRFVRHQLSQEGLELTLATNHLGHFVLMLSLIDLLASSGQARIVNVSSGTYYSGTGAIEKIQSAREYDGRKQYSNSKLANVLFTYALVDKLRGKGITVNSCEPGGVATNFARNNGFVHWLKHRLYYLGKGQLLTPAPGADTVVYLASSDEVAGVTGRHFFQRKELRSSERAYDKTLQAELWSLRRDLAGIDL
jgi:NAD(P)-dependent dehydrogenase (short-subunit alcohol dehydrogenase family)